eukprot:jgi/Bigna1/134185/aug1.24_g8893
MGICASAEPLPTGPDNASIEAPEASNTQMKRPSALSSSPAVAGVPTLPPRRKTTQQNTNPSVSELSSPPTPRRPSKRTKGGEKAREEGLPAASASTTKTPRAEKGEKHNKETDESIEEEKQTSVGDDAERESKISKLKKSNSELQLRRTTTGGHRVLIGSIRPLASSRANTHRWSSLRNIKSLASEQLTVLWQREDQEYGFLSKDEYKKLVVGPSTAALKKVPPHVLVIEILDYIKANSPLDDLISHWKLVDLAGSGDIDTATNAVTLLNVLLEQCESGEQQEKYILAWGHMGLFEKIERSNVSDETFRIQTQAFRDFCCDAIEIDPKYIQLRVLTHRVFDLEAKLDKLGNEREFVLRDRQYMVHKLKTQTAEMARAMRKAQEKELPFACIQPRHESRVVVDNDSRRLTELPEYDKWATEALVRSARLMKREMKTTRSAIAGMRSKRDDLKAETKKLSEELEAATEESASVAKKHNELKERHDKLFPEYEEVKRKEEDTSMELNAVETNAAELSEAKSLVFKSLEQLKTGEEKELKKIEEKLAFLSSEEIAEKKILSLRLELETMLIRKKGGSKREDSNAAQVNEKDINTSSSTEIPPVPDKRPNAQFIRFGSFSFNQNNSSFQINRYECRVRIAEGAIPPPPVLGGVPLPPAHLSGIPPPPGELAGVPPPPGLGGGIPPPPGSASGVLPPPPMLMPGGLLSKGSASTKTKPTKPKITPKKKMRPLFWKPIIVSMTNNEKKQKKENATANDPIEDDDLSPTIWHKLTLPSLDEEALLSKFSKMGPSKPVKAANQDKRSNRSRKRQIVRILDSKRSNQLAIMASQLPSIDETRIAIIEMDQKTLNEGKIAKILGSMASVEEITAIKVENQHSSKCDDAAFAAGLVVVICPFDAALDADGEDVNLDKPERFCLMLASIPSVGERLKSWHMAILIPDEAYEWNTYVRRLRKVCEELRQSKDLKRLFGAILAIGNYVNGGTNRGQADGFKIDILGKMKSIKTKYVPPVITRDTNEDEKDAISVNDKSSLLKLVICMIRSKLGSSRQLWKRFKYLLACGDIPGVKELKSSANRIVTSFKFVKKAAQKIKAITSSNSLDKYGEKMDGFIQEYQPTIDGLLLKSLEMETVYREVHDFFGNAIESKESKYLPSPEFFTVLNGNVILWRNIFQCFIRDIVAEVARGEKIMAKKTKRSRMVVANYFVVDCPSSPPSSQNKKKRNHRKNYNKKVDAGSIGARDRIARLRGLSLSRKSESPLISPQRSGRASISRDGKLYMSAPGYDRASSSSPKSRASLTVLPAGVGGLGSARRASVSKRSSLTVSPTHTSAALSKRHSLTTTPSHANPIRLSVISPVGEE